MPKFNIEVQWHYHAFDYKVFEVEGESLDDAKNKALAMAPNAGDWCEGQIIDGNYEINHDECEETQ